MEDFIASKQLIMSDDDSSVDRMYAEQSKLNAFFPQFYLSRSRTGGDLSAKGWLNTNLGSTYNIIISIPDNYPYSMPSVAPDGWSTSGAPHVYSNNGTLCLMKSAQWRSYMTLAFVVSKSAIWLNKYDVWKERGAWPGAEQGHGLMSLLEDLFD